MLQPDRKAESARRRWMSVLARASRGELEAAWADLPHQPAYDFLRRAERGMVMVRGRAGGTGDPFNFGEMTVTRCAIRLADGTTGHCYAAGRDLRKAELAAAFDALLQTDARLSIQSSVIQPLARRQAEDRRRISRKAAATKVDFFTMVRGDNPR